MYKPTFFINNSFPSEDQNQNSGSIEQPKQELRPTRTRQSVGGSLGSIVILDKKSK